MIEKVVTALESKFKRIHINPQEKAQHGALFVTLDDVPILVGSLETYFLRFTYCISFVDMEIASIETTIKNIILALETIDSDKRFICEEKSISLEGTAYIVSVAFQVDEELQIK